MDELLRDFLQETGEHVEVAGAQLIQLERDPTDTAMIAAIFRLLHTIKGTSGFLGLTRLGKLAHAAEALLTRLREGAPATSETVALILAAVDRVKFLLAEIERQQAEPLGSDDELIGALSRETGAYAPASAPTIATALYSQSVPPEPRPATDVSDARAATIRVAISSLDSMATLVSELVLTRNQLADVARRAGHADVSAALGRLSSVVTDLQDQVMHARMQSLERIFATLPRLARDLARELGKEIALVLEGGETELDRQLIEVVRDPLMHLIRNCADHGLESTVERLAAGKSGVGTIRVTALHVAGQILIEVGDDGRGLDLPRIGVTALRRGLVNEAILATMSIDDVARLVFEPGFSTAASVTAISGRGVGLDVVRANIEAIGGDVSVAWTVGGGTCFTVRIPLTLAIAPALIVTAGGQRFALPQLDVAEIVETGPDSPHRREIIQGCEVLNLRGDIVPLIDLASLLRLGSRSATDGVSLVAIVRCGGAVLGLGVDAVEDTQEIVVKPIGALLAGLRLYAGHTILGDGSAVLIVDPRGVADTLGLRRTTADRATVLPPATKASVTRMLTFRAGGMGIKALPLAMVKRIETVRPADVERSAGRLVIQREDGLMALIPLVEGAPLRNPEQPVLILETSGHTFGVLVDEIVDIVDAATDIAVPGLASDALGVSSVNGQVTEFVDSLRLLRHAGVSLSGARVAEPGLAQ